MSDQQRPTDQDLVRERALYRYSSALDRGDFDTVAAVLLSAEHDPVLEQMIVALNAEFEAESGSEADHAAATLVRQLLAEHLPSSFIDHHELPAPSPLTVGDVAARMQNDAAIKGAIAQEFASTTRQLRRSDQMLPEDLSQQQVAQLFANMGYATVGKQLQKRFRETAILLTMGRSQGIARLAATRRLHTMREPMPSYQAVPQSPLQRPSIGDAIAELYRNAGISHPSVQRSVAPLDALIGSCNLMLSELTGLTSDAASQFLLRRGGLVEPISGTTSERLAGFLYVHQQYGSIFVDRSDPVARRRFSATHELGHYLLHFQPLLQAAHSEDIPALTDVAEALPGGATDVAPDAMPQGQLRLPSSMSIYLPPVDQMEREANQFAADLLMPVDLLQALVARYTPHLQDNDLLWRLSTDLLVSRAALLWRLRHVGLLPPGIDRTN